MQAMQGVKFKTTDEYIDSFPKSTREKLQEMRKTVLAAAPGAEEVISYNMPAIRTNSVLVYYAGYKQHIGFYPTASGIKNFQSSFNNYKTSKGAVQFPLDKKLPLALVKKIVQFRAREVAEKAGNKEK
jgi:uncharacterized protein YdhG (YjbR/CyaY superfamily)